MKLYTKEDFGEMIFQQIKKQIEGKGYSMKQEKFPPNFPVSRRVLYDLKRGIFTESLLARLGVKARQYWTLSK